MRLLLALWALAGTPKLGVPAAYQQKDGTWKCSAMCLTGGNDDGGYCRTPVLSIQPSRDECTADLEKQCAKVKPPPGGCRWDGNRTAGK